MKKVIAVVAFLFSGLAMADDYRNIGGYMGLGVISAKRLDWNSPGDDTATGYKIFAGGNLKYAGIEAGFVNLGEAGNGAFNHSATGWEAAAMGRLPIGQSFAAYGRGGWMWTRNKVSSASNHTRANEGFFGAGLEYGTKVRVRAEWIRYDVGIGDIDGLHLSLVSVVQ